MKRLKKTACALMFMLIAMITMAPLCYGEGEDGRTSIKEVKQETRDLLRTIKAYTADQRDEALGDIKKGLDKLDERINALEARVDARWDHMEKAARERARANLRALRRQRTRVAEWYGSMRSGSIDAWAHMKKGFSDAYRALSDAWEKSEKEFESGT